MQHSGASDLDLHFLPKSHKRDARLSWIHVGIKEVNVLFPVCKLVAMGAQWLSGRMLDSRPKGRGFESLRGHCVVVLEQDTFILA